MKQKLWYHCCWPGARRVAWNHHDGLGVLVVAVLARGVMLDSDVAHVYQTVKQWIQYLHRETGRTYPMDDQQY
jgi:hypothetical protein